MRYTEKLNLPIIEDSDNFALSFTQPNEISEKLENIMGTYPELTENMKTLQDSFNELIVENTELKESVENLNSIKQSTIDFAIAVDNQNLRQELTNVQSYPDILRLITNFTENSKSDLFIIDNGNIKVKEEGVYAVNAQVEIMNRGTSTPLSFGLMLDDLSMAKFNTVKIANELGTDVTMNLNVINRFRANDTILFGLKKETNGSGIYAHSMLISIQKIA